jgi:hypothetical protein
LNGVPAPVQPIPIPHEILESSSDSDEEHGHPAKIQRVQTPPAQTQPQ